MRTTKRWGYERSDPLGIRPQLGFAGATFGGFAAWVGLMSSIPGDLLVPGIATYFLLFSAGFGVIAWLRRGREDPRSVTYADVAGALTLIGLCMTSTIDPDQLVRAMTGSDTEN